MEKNRKIYNSIEEWEKEGRPNDCYYFLNVEFDIFCKKCGKKAIIYVENSGAFDCQNVIKCNECGNEKELYGCDG